MQKEAEAAYLVYSEGLHYFSFFPLCHKFPSSWVLYPVAISGLHICTSSQLQPEMQAHEAMLSMVYMEQLQGCKVAGLLFSKWTH